MGFITVDVVNAGRTVAAQFSDSKLTVRRLMDVVCITLRRTDGGAGLRLEYLDNEGDWVAAVSDADVAELFAVAKTLAPARLQVRLHFN